MCPQINRRPLWRHLTLVVLLTGCSALAWGLDYRVEASLQNRYFIDNAAQGQARHHPSAQLDVEFWHSLNQGQDLLSFAPFVRLDARDSQRNLVDIRDLSWIHVANNYELRSGIRQVYWGVTEGARLVNIINQTDGADGPDTDRTLGQPMVNLALQRGNHMLDLFVLIGARERTFPGEDGRLRFPVAVDPDQSRFESSRGRDRLDLAARWQWNHYPFVLGLSAFSGNAREPELGLGPDPQRPRLTPFYPLIHQAGLDLQVTQGDLLWKLEAIQRWGGRENFHAINAGFEFTQVGILGSRMNLGWLLEGLYHSRERSAAAPFERDVLLGWRLEFNDLAGSEILASTIIDTRTAEQLISIEGRRRLGENWSLAAQVRYISGSLQPQTAEAFLTDPDSRYPLSPLSRDSYGHIELSWFF